MDYIKSRKLLGLARAALFATAATQLVLVPHFFFPFVTTRNVFFRLSVELAVVAVLLLGVKRLRDIDAKRDGVLAWFGIYLVALGVSAVAGLAPWHSVFGDFERMGGVFAWLHLFLFYCLLRVLMREGDWAVLFRLIVIVADIIVLFGATEFLPSSVRNPLFQTTLDAGSTIGNQGLLGPYLLLAAVLAIWDVSHTGKRFWRILSSASVAILLFGIAGSRNRSSELGLLVGFVVATGIFLHYSTDRKRVASKLLLVAVVTALVFGTVAGFLAARAPGMAEHFGGRWKGFLSSPVDHSRTIEWNIALNGFRDRPLTGYGPENHQIIASHHFDPAIYAVLPDGVFDRTHNAWLELLATTGLIGTLAMVGVWLAAIATIRRGFRERSVSSGEAAIFSGALAAYATYLTFWFFDVNSVLVWVVLLAFVSSRVNGPLAAFAEDLPRGKRPLAWAAVGLTLLTAYLQGIVPLKAAHSLSRAAEGGGFNERLMAFESVLNSSAPQTLHTFPLYYGFLRNAAPQMSSPNTSPVFRKEFDLAMQRGGIEADRTVARNKTDDRSYVEAARFFSLAAVYYSDVRYVQLAKRDLLKAARISPRRPDVRVLLSNVELTLRDSVGAAAQLDSAMAFAPAYLPTFVYASKLQLARGSVDSSASLLLRAVSGRPMPVESLLKTVIDSLRARGENAQAAEIGSRYVESVFGPSATWRHVPDPSASTAFAFRIAGLLPILYVNAGNESRALQAARDLVVLQPASRTAAAQFVADVNSGRASTWKSRKTLFAASEASISSTVAR